jgi:asparagine synthase (glutamine-hydrolysing)
VRLALIDSVAHHFVSDVPVGIMLSGGVDSAVMLALANQSGHSQVRTVSMSLPGSTADEGTLARRTADRFSSNHVECALDAQGARKLFPHYLRAIDQPSIDGFNTFVVSKFAREQGLKVMLSGVGADELFGGYGSFARVPRMTAWNAQLAWAGPLRSLGGRMLEQWAPDPRWRRVGDLLQQPPTVANTYATFRGIFTRRESRRLASAFGVDVDGVESIDEAVSSPTIEDEISRLELTRYVRNQLVRDSDAASMACGVELRAPFLDATLFETLARVPSAIRLASAKRLLRDAVQELPPWVSGPKRCFQFPFEDWVAKEWRPVFAGLDARSPVSTGTWYRKVCLYVLEHWIDRMKSDGC